MRPIDGRTVSYLVFWQGSFPPSTVLYWRFQLCFCSDFGCPVDISSCFQGLDGLGRKGLPVFCDDFHSSMDVFLPMQQNAPNRRTVGVK